MSIPDEVASLDESTEIPQEVAEIEETTQIPIQVAEIQDPENDPETQPLLISFAKYNNKMCQISDGMEKNHPKKVLEILKEIGMHMYTADDLPKLGKTIKPVKYAGDYRDLFKGLHEDVDLQEIYIDSSKGRIFYFLVDSILHLVAIRGSHLDTTKS